MKIYFLNTRIYCLLTLSIFVTSCNGQVKTNLPNDSASRPHTIPGQSKIIKTQGTGPGANIHCGLQDKAGKLWFGTTGEGLFCYDGKSFSNFTMKDGLSDNSVWCILEDKTGNLWIGTADGACRFDGKKFVTIPIAEIKRSESNFLNSSNKQAQENSVWKIFQDKAGKLWFGTNDGLYVYDGQTFINILNIEGVENNTGVTIDKVVEAILEDKEGNIWFSGRANKGAFRFNGKSLTNYKPDGENWVWPVLEDKKGNIWFSNWGGAYLYDGKSVVNFAKKEGSCVIDITCIAEDKDGDIWFGSDSKNKGLCRYDGKSFTHFTTKDGLINNSVWTIVEDKLGNLWVGTRNTGLCRYYGKIFTCFSE